MNARTPRIVDRLRRQADLRFVGREAELDIARQAITQNPPPFSVLWVHGPGGIGKTAFTERLRSLASEAGMDTLRIDARDLNARTPGAFLDTLAVALGMHAGPDTPLPALLAEVLAAWSARPRRLLIVDTFELLAPLEAWLRDKVLAELPEPSLVVLAGRQAPGRFWLNDPLWSGGLQPIGLRNLAPGDCARLLAGRHIDPALGEATLRLTYGHPLALTLLADVIQARGAVPDALDTDLIRQLMDCVVSGMPSDLHRQALEVCACARATTQDLLADIVDAGRAAELFEWLASQSYIEAGPLGLFPHDLVRDAVLAELRWRHPSRTREVAGHLLDHYVRRMASAVADNRSVAALDILYLQRFNPVMRRFVDFSAVGAASFDTARDCDVAPMAAMALAELGPESDAQIRRWWGHPAARFWVARDGTGRMIGCTFLVDVTRLDEAELARDACFLHAAQWAAEHAPARPGEAVLCAPFIVAEGGIHMPTPGMNTLQTCMMFHWLTTRGLALFFITTDDPAYWAPMMRYIDFHLARTPAFRIDGRDGGLFVHDWRAMPPDRWLQLVTARGQEASPDGDGEGAQPLAALEPVVVLSRSLFERAVKDALRQFGDLPMLAGNPLARSRLVRAAGQAGEAAEQTLRRLLRDAVAALGEHPRGQKFQRALELTYLTPAGSQEMAAERLGLLFSTYRYQLSTGIERVTDTLWQQEIAAPAGAAV